jgi:outer membrane protein assembly factor BamB
LALLAVAAALPADWPQFRGPESTGCGKAAKLPDAFGPTSQVAWKAALGGDGASTPAVLGKRVFVTVQDGSKKTFAVCLNLADGRELWRKPAGSGFDNRQGNTAATPSPAADQKAAYFLFGSGDLVAFDHDGKELWRRDLQKDYGKFEIMWDYGASPLLHDGRLYLAVIHGKGEGDKSYILCLSAADGGEVWKQPRPAPASGEGKQAYTTPLLAQVNGKATLIIAGADIVTGHDPASGKELWRSTSYKSGSRLVATPVIIDGTIIICLPRGEAMMGLKPSGSGQLPQSDWKWTRKGGSPDVCSPVALDGKAYVLDGEKGVLSCMDPADGRTLGKCELGIKGILQAAPTAGDGRIFCMGMGGDVVVASAADEPKVLYRASFGGKRCRASVVPCDEKLLVRAADQLYCLSAASPTAAAPSLPGAEAARPAAKP